MASALVWILMLWMEKTFEKVGAKNKVSIKWDDQNKPGRLLIASVSKARAQGYKLPIS
jgi:hypothetical protein